MSYFDPEIYNEDNLKEQDKREIQFWRDSFLMDIDNALKDVCGFGENDKTLDKIKREIIEEYIEALKVRVEYSVNDVIVSIIDNYDDENGGEEE